MDQVEERVVKIVSRITKTPRERIRLDTDLRRDLNVDSLQGLQIVAALEEEFGVTVPDDDLDLYERIESIVVIIRRLTSATPTATS